MQGHRLVIALSRTADEIEVTDRYGRVSRMSPSNAIHLVCDSDCYVGTGSKRRVRSIAYQEPEPVEITVEDSGFDGFARYPLPDQSTVEGRILRLAA